MLKITIPATEIFDPSCNEFINVKGQTIALEHSLVSISKWESKWHKPYLDKRYEKTKEEAIDYIRCMTLTQNVDPKVYYCIPGSEAKKIADYIQDPMTATWFSNEENQKGKSQPIITSEIIYYWMVSYQIPFECQKWHLNRLITLIKVCDEKNKKQKKMSRNEQYARRNKLNAARRASGHSRG